MQEARNAAEGESALRRLITDLEGQLPISNEAETRFNIVDRILIECLGWPRKDMNLERHKDSIRTDYELGNPRKIICEAKAASVLFDPPPNPSKKVIVDIRS